MYRYDEFDAQFVRERVGQFRDQVSRRLTGALDEDEFRPLRLTNGLYLQLHAYMLRVAIPYGTLSSRQLRQLAMIAERYDRGYGHFTTRQNIQFNWPELVDVPDILDHLADVEMHGIQTSGNAIRNVTSDPWAGAAADEICDPRPYCELIRQWSSLHPEFSFLPRKFKIAVTAAVKDRAAVAFHDIGLRIVALPGGAIGFDVLVGGGMGRTPFLAKTVRDALPEPELLGYLEAIMRVYNRYGRRDNKYKARIKILVHELGLEPFKAEVEAEYAAIGGPSAVVADQELARIAAYFAPPNLEILLGNDAGYLAARRADSGFDAWARVNVAAHRAHGYGIVNISLKPAGGIPGDATADQMRAVADLADRYALGEIRVTHQQNLVLAHVRQRDLRAVYDALIAHDLATANVGLIGDIISCPGLDYCSLATARSIPIAQAISARFADPARQEQIGPLPIKISGCINACGHHHAGAIGILGLEKKGEEYYQITLGGSGEEDASIGALLGPGISGEAVPETIERLVETYLANRTDPSETFLAAYRRLGPQAFEEALHAAH